MYHACRVTLIPEDFRGPSFLFFFFLFSLSIFFPTIDFRFPFRVTSLCLLSNGIWFNERRRKKSWQKAISMCPERYCAFGSWSWTKLQGITVHRLLSALFALFKYNRLIHTRGKILHWWKSDASIL